VTIGSGLAPVLARAPATSVEEVIARLMAIDAALPAADGIACFNKLYLAVTQNVLAVKARRDRLLITEARGSWVNLGPPGGPTWLRWAIWTLGVLGSPRMRPAFEIARKKRDRVPRDGAATSFEIPDLSDLTRELSSDIV